MSFNITAALTTVFALIALGGTIAFSGMSYLHRWWVFKLLAAFLATLCAGILVGLLAP